MGLEFRFNAKDFEKAMRELPRDLEKELNLASKISAKAIQSDAQNEHRFDTRTGRLVKSIVGYSVAKEVKLVLHDVGHALGTKYGKYVHGGHGSWSADKFIENAMRKNEKNIFKRWQEAINKASKDF